MVINSLSFNKNIKAKPVKLNLELRTLDMLCRYVLQNNNYVKMEHFINLRKLINVLDESVYNNDPDKLKRVNFIIKGLEARLDNNLNDIDIILTYINGGLQFQIDFLDYDRLLLTKDEIAYVHSFVAETLKYQFVYDSVDEMQDICTRFKTSDFNNRGNIINEFEGLIDNLKNQFRHTKVNDNSIDMTFSLREGEFESAITNTWNIISNPSRRLISGMQGLNEMIGGGFESGRVYMLLGTSGIGKSMTLINLIYQMKRFNNYYKPKDPSRTPCIVLLTMENTVVETITRIFSLVIEGAQGMQNYTAQDCINMLRNQGQLFINDSSPIDIVIKYKANKSVDTSYLYTLYDDLYDDGYEMICLVQDHAKRIRSIYSNTDLRLELGDVVNELKVFAADKDIPVITNSHLNRDAARVIEEASRKGNQDMGKLLGKSNIGESMLMIDNLDCAIIITLDFDKDQNKYMTFNLVKMRDKTSRTYIAQPFSPTSDIRLLEDFGGPPQFKETIHAGVELNKGHSIVRTSGASAMTGTIDAIIDFDDEDDDDNAFAEKNIYELSEDGSIANINNNLEQIGNDFKNQFDSVLSDIKSFNQPVCPIIFFADSDNINYDSFDLNKLVL